VKRTLAGLLMTLGLVAFAGRVPAQDVPPDASDLLNTLLAGLLGFRDMTGPELQSEIAEVGGVPFRSDVPLDYMSRSDLGRYLQELLETEYPESRARADGRTLVAFDLLAPGSDMREIRGRLLLENVAGFYDERPGRKRLYAVSEDKRLTPANQIILSHELRHALQDQYAAIHAVLPSTIGDFDDRRMAFLSVLEGDATLVMERFLVRRLPGAPEELPDLTGMAIPASAVPDVPPVLRDQLVLPYFVGREFARALLKQGGWEALKTAWGRPPSSTEQVLHPEKYFAGEAPRTVDLPYAPPGGSLLNEGVLGELFVRTLLGEESPHGAAAGWGGDAFRVWDVSGRTLLVWRAEWDGAADGAEFHAAALARFRRRHGAGVALRGFDVFSAGGWRYALAERAGATLLVSSDDAGALDRALQSLQP
jgi:hypothetical protein